MKKKIIGIIICTLFLFSTFGSVALPYEKESLNTQDFNLEIIVQGYLFGYKVTYANAGDEPFTGDFLINITTEASSFILIGKELSDDFQNFTLEPEYPIIPRLKPLIGFGTATIKISGKFTHENGMEYPFELETSGIILLFWVLMKTTTINLP